MKKVICCWCGKETEIKGNPDDYYGYRQEICDNCGRLIPSSKKMKEDGTHWHRDYKEGEITT